MKSLKNPIILLLLFLASNSYALIHETMEQCDTRYGTPESVSTHKSGEVTRYYDLTTNYHMAISFYNNKAMYIIYGKYDGKDRVYEDFKFEDKYIIPNKKSQTWHFVDDNRTTPGHIMANEWHWISYDGKILFRMDAINGLWYIQDMRYDLVTKEMVK